MRTWEKPPAEPDSPQWDVYEQILKVPHYILYDRYTSTLRVFELKNTGYEEQPLNEPKIWFPDLKAGLGLWQGIYDDVPALWLRWFDEAGNWILTEAEQERQQRELAEQQRELAEQQRELAEQRAERLAQRLRELGLEP